MQFNSYSYLLLLVPAVLVFWALPNKWRQPYVITLSVLYYATWNALFILVPLGLCVGVHLMARKLNGTPERSREWFWSGIAFALTVFLVFRYQPFLTNSFNAALGLIGAPAFRASWKIAVPLGISFYTFEAISYLIDVRQGRIKHSRFFDLYTFVMFWPHLMAGPIVRFRELAPQFKFSRRFELSMVTSGLSRLVLGLVQKNVIADSLGSWVDEGFLPKAALNHTTIDNWALALAFGLQIYFDFSSYSNMAIGVAQLIGVTLPENFRFPYHARTPADFWSRWHMTLSRWIRDYLFFPVNARFRDTPGFLYASMVGIMALVGLWHGPGWNFVLWGGMHGVFLVLYRAWENTRDKRFPALANSRIIAIGWRAFTLCSVTAAWIPFRASTGAQALRMLASMFIRIRLGVSYSANFYLATLLVAAICFLEPFLAALVARLELWMAKRQGAVVTSTYALWPLVYAFGLLLFLAFDDRNAQFIYFQF